MVMLGLCGCARVCECVQENLKTNKGVKGHARPCKGMLSSVQFSSFAQLCPTLCDPMDCSTPGFTIS